MPDLPDRLKDYITVAQRIEAFYERYPEGSLQARIVELSETLVVMEASAFRTADDLRPGIGFSSMPIPAPNTMLRGSEIETCETSAWGRAIAALGFEVKKAVASQNEIDAKKSGRSEPNPRAGASDYEPPDHEDGSLIGTAEIGKAPADFELRATPDGGAAIAFRLANGRRSFKVIAVGPLAYALQAHKPEIVDQRVSAWGHLSDETFTPKGTTKEIIYKVLALTRLQAGDLILPVEGAAGNEAGVAGVTPAQEAELDALPLFEDSAA